MSQDEFFAYISPRDIVLDTHRECTVWSTRSRVEVGRSWPGYVNTESPSAYMLSDAARNTLADSILADYGYGTA